VKRASAGYRFIHTAIDDRTGLAYSEIHTDEQAAAAFWRRAPAWFRAQGDHRRAGPDQQRVLLPITAVDRCAHRHRRDRETNPALPAPGPTRSNVHRISSRNGHTSRPGARTANAPSPTPGSRTSTIVTVPTALSAGQHPPTPSPASPGTTSPACTTSPIANRWRARHGSRVRGRAVTAARPSPRAHGSRLPCETERCTPGASMSENRTGRIAPPCPRTSVCSHVPA
jgi:hypothetical protein